MSLEHLSPSPHPILTPERLRAWGYTDDEIAQLEISPSRKQGTTVIDWGIPALDCEEKGDFSEDPAMGNLATVDSAGKITLRDGSAGSIFAMPSREALEHGTTGGIGNPAQIMSLILANEEAERLAPGARIADMQATMRWIISMRLGGEGDVVGDIYQKKIPANIEQWARRCQGKTSGLSLVRTQQAAVKGVVAQGNRAIYFRPGAGGSAMADKEDLFEIACTEPDCVAAYYPGLWQWEDGMDTTDGERFAWFAEHLSGFCPIVATDLHSPTRMPHIEKALPFLDMVNGNLQEMATVFLGKDPGDEDKMTPEQKEDLWRRLPSALREHYMRKNGGRTRMATVTDAGGCLLVFQSLSTSYNAYLPSPFAGIPADSKKGAGDTRYAGQRLYAAHRAEKWRNGTFGIWDACNAVQVGQLLATLKIQPPSLNALDGVTMAKMERVVIDAHQAHRTYDNIDDLLRNLKQA
ncbi:MAG: hypothetical protein PHH13_01935 [Candidatus Peribacteraceae bacterium]|nr:hypothetical protein [Candidatus Peribacteraceae bacterium]